MCDDGNSAPGHFRVPLCSISGPSGLPARRGADESGDTRSVDEVVLAVVAVPSRRPCDPGIAAAPTASRRLVPDPEMAARGVLLLRGEECSRPRSKRPGSRKGQVLQGLTLIAAASPQQTEAPRPPCQSKPVGAGMGRPCGNLRDASEVAA